MKKLLGATILALAIGITIIAGTTAVYNVELGTIAEADTVAKEFAITGEGDSSFSDTVKIAPTETVTKRFTVSNFDGSIISETPMKTTIKVDLTAADNMNAIPYLTVSVYKVDNSKRTLVGTTITDGAGSMTFEDGFNLSSTGTTHTYEAEIVWPDTNGLTDSNANGKSDDAEYAGKNYGNTIQITVTGTQVDDATSYIK